MVYSTTTNTYGRLDNMPSRPSPAGGRGSTKRLCPKPCSAVTLGFFPLLHETPELFRLERHFQMRYAKRRQGVNNGIGHCRR